MTDATALGPPVDDAPFAALKRWWGGHALAQIVLLAVLFALIAFFAHNVLVSMRRLGIEPSLGYLYQPANFDISESLIAYHAGDPYWQAILVGVLNTLKLAVSGCALATALGLTLGLARVAGNPLISWLIQIYVELVRNTPLTLQLFFWIASTHALPSVRQSFQPLPSTFLSVRGVFLPWFHVEGEIWPLIVIVAAAALVVRAIHRIGKRPLKLRETVAIPVITFAAAAGWVWLSGLKASPDLPALKGFNIVGGLSLTPEFAAMVAGLSIYYAANVSEIVRSGLQSVTKGQWEAGRALGLSRGRILQLVVLPQAMRVITPLMTSTYLDLTKDTTLGVLIGYTELTAVIKTSANNTGNVVETILVLVIVFLAISLPVSAAINVYNRALARRGLVNK